MKLVPTIAIDSREQCPLVFESLPSEVGTLDCGDYSICGIEHLISVERKSLDDLLACCGRERARFKRELKKLEGYRFRSLVVETDAATLEGGNWRSKLKPAHVLGSLSAWTAQHGLCVWLAGDHDGAARFVERYLYQSARCIVNEYAAASAFVERSDAV